MFSRLFILSKGDKILLILAPILMQTIFLPNFAEFFLADIFVLMLQEEYVFVKKNFLLLKISITVGAASVSRNLVNLFVSKLCLAHAQ